ncbi:hypothetical protein BJ742DRAFT_838771 [Cladochytrium replicatum]|nr:hypothetical protein BJ742DRAFT_838771 [Cladochytrium replicatum]
MSSSSYSLSAFPNSPFANARQSPRNLSPSSPRHPSSPTSPTEPFSRRTASRSTTAAISAVTTIRELSTTAELLSGRTLLSKLFATTLPSQQRHGAPTNPPPPTQILLAPEEFIAVVGELRYKNGVQIFGVFPRPDAVSSSRGPNVFSLPRRAEIIAESLASSSHPRSAPGQVETALDEALSAPPSPSPIHMSPPPTGVSVPLDDPERCLAVIVLRPLRDPVFGRHIYLDYVATERGLDQESRSGLRKIMLAHAEATASSAGLPLVRASRAVEEMAEGGRVGRARSASVAGRGRGVVEEVRSRQRVMSHSGAQQFGESLLGTPVVEHRQRRRSNSRVADTEGSLEGSGGRRRRPSASVRNLDIPKNVFGETMTVSPTRMNGEEEDGDVARAAGPSAQRTPRGGRARTYSNVNGRTGSTLDESETAIAKELLKTRKSLFNLKF